MPSINFYKFINQSFDEIEGYLDQIILFSNEKNDAALKEQRELCNEYIKSLETVLESQIETLEKSYKECDYLKTNSWEKEKETIMQVFAQIIATFEQPFFNDKNEKEEDDFFENAEVDLSYVKESLMEDKKLILKNTMQLMTHLTSFDSFLKYQLETKEQQSQKPSAEISATSQKLVAANSNEKAGSYLR